MPELVQDVLLAAAAGVPDGAAVRHRGSEWSWKRLADESLAVAESLVALGVRPGDRVGLLLPKRLEAVAGFYGILLAGGVYVPLDPLAPASYAAAVASDCGIATVLATPSRAAELAAELPNGPIRAALIVDDGTQGPDRGQLSTLPYPVSRGGPHPRALPAIRATDAEAPEAPIPELAYLAYTSGSTGRPKGVMVTHRALLLQCRWLVSEFGMGQGDRLSVFPPLHFKMSLYGIISAAISHATSVLISLETGFRGQDLARIIRDEGITHWKSVPAPLREVAESGAAAGSLPSLRVVQAGGGEWRPKDVRAIRFLAPQAELWQSYGSAEACTTFVHRIDGVPEDGERIPIGRVVAGVRAAVVADGGSSAGLGEPGELFVNSPKLMLGYWNDPERTAKAFAADPTGHSSDRWYRTGDIVRQQENGDYVFVGRRDEMIKTRGYRVELGMVEAALVAHAGVADAAVVAAPHERWGKAIVAFVEPVAHAAAATLTEESLRAHVAARLPVYMIPLRVTVMRPLPRTSTGKVDRVKLGAVAAEGADAARAADATPTARGLAPV